MAAAPQLTTQCQRQELGPPAGRRGIVDEQYSHYQPYRAARKLGQIVVTTPPVASIVRISTDATAK